MGAVSVVLSAGETREIAKGEELVAGVSRSVLFSVCGRECADVVFVPATRLPLHLSSLTAAPFDAVRAGPWSLSATFEAERSVYMFQVMRQISV